MVWLSRNLMCGCLNKKGAGAHRIMQIAPTRSKQARALRPQPYLTIEMLHPAQLH